MNEKYAQLLSEELRRQLTYTEQSIDSFDINIDYFFESLSENKIIQRTKSAKFSVILGEIENSIPISDTAYHILSVTRILRNEEAKKYSLSSMSGLLEALNSKLGWSNSSKLTRNLRKNKNLVELMELHSLECPFSLLGELKTYDYSNTEELMKISQKPFLIIPNISNRSLVEDWEIENSQYYLERIFMPDKKITKLEYFKI